MAVTTWNIDPAHTDVLFSAKHMMVTTVRGKFHEVTGTITVDEDDPTTATGSFVVAAGVLPTWSIARWKNRWPVWPKSSATASRATI